MTAPIETPPAERLLAADFDKTYQLRMITAYPVIAEMDADELMLATPDEKREAFERTLANRHLDRTHRLYLEAGAS